MSRIPRLSQPKPDEPTYSATDPAYAAIRARVERLKAAKEPTKASPPPWGEATTIDDSDNEPLR